MDFIVYNDDFYQDASPFGGDKYAASTGQFVWANFFDALDGKTKFYATVYYYTVTYPLIVALYIWTTYTHIIIWPFQTTYDLSIEAYDYLYAQAISLYEFVLAIIGSHC